MTHQISVEDAHPVEVSIASSAGVGKPTKRLTGMITWDGKEAYARFRVTSGDDLLYHGCNLVNAVQKYNEAP